MKALLAFLLLCSAQFCSARTNTNRVYTGDWSEVTNGLRGRLEISDSGRVEGNTHYSVVYLELENRSDTANPMKLHYDARDWKSKLTNDSGASPAPEGFFGDSVVMVGPESLILPNGATIKCPISMNGTSVRAKTGGMVVEMPGGLWVVPGQASEDFHLSADLVMTITYAGGMNPRQGTIRFPIVKIPRKPTP